MMGSMAKIQYHLTREQSADAITALTVAAAVQCDEDTHTRWRQLAAYLAGRHALFYKELPAAARPGRPGSVAS